MTGVQTCALPISHIYDVCVYHYYRVESHCLMRDDSQVIGYWFFLCCSLNLCVWDFHAENLCIQCGMHSVGQVRSST